MENMITFGSSKGDVLIILSKDHIALAHSAIIRECCTNIAPLLTEERGAKLNTRTINTATIRWRVDLVYNTGKYSFVGKHVTELGRSDPTYGINHDLLEPVLLNTMMDTVAMLYRNPPKFDSRLRPLLTKCLRYIQAAKIFGALPSVRGNVENAILNCSDEIWPHIARNPAEWLATSLQLTSKSLFKEALIHTIGKWKVMSIESRSRIAASPQLRDLITCKLSDTWQIKKSIERRVLAYHPQILKDVKKDSRVMKGEAPGRSVYSTHIFPWIALCLYRQWFGQMMTEGCGLRAGDGGFTLYTALSQGGEKYLKHTELQSFYEIFPMTDKAKTIIENTLKIIKEGVKELVIPVVAQKGFLNDVNHLTFTNVEEEDYPWVGALGEEVMNKVQEYIRKNPELGIWCPTEPAPSKTTSIIGISDLLGDYGLHPGSIKKRATSTVKSVSTGSLCNVKPPKETAKRTMVEERVKNDASQTSAARSASKTQIKARSYDGSDDVSDYWLDDYEDSDEMDRHLPLTTANLALLTDEHQEPFKSLLKNEVDKIGFSREKDSEIRREITQQKGQPCQPSTTRGFQEEEKETKKPTWLNAAVSAGDQAGQNHAQESHKRLHGDTIQPSDKFETDAQERPQKRANREQE